MLQFKEKVNIYEKYQMNSSKQVITVFPQNFYQIRFAIVNIKNFCCLDNVFFPPHLMHVTSSGTHMESNLFDEGMLSGGRKGDETCQHHNFFFEILQHGKMHLKMKNFRKIK